MIEFLYPSTLLECRYVCSNLHRGMSLANSFGVVSLPDSCNPPYTQLKLICLYEPAIQDPRTQKKKQSGVFGNENCM